jgi:peptidoglycan hydrolase-like protein with peptidoglycan-binding domain
MSWRLAKSLIKLREQLDAAHPNRSKVSDGSIGDQSHSARKSDHNPNAQGVVTAIDITADPANGIRGDVLSRALAQDKRTKYVIWNGKIFRSYKPQLGWAAYTGTNRHDKHVHISVLASGYDDVSPWFNLESEEPTTQRLVLRFGDTGQAVVDLQRALGIRMDGRFGPKLLAEVKAFQRTHGLEPDGIVGRASWGKLRELGRVK